MKGYEPEFVVVKVANLLSGLRVSSLQISMRTVAEEAILTAWYKIIINRDEEYNRLVVNIKRTGLPNDSGALAPAKDASAVGAINEKSLVSNGKRV